MSNTSSYGTHSISWCFVRTQCVGHWAMHGTVQFPGPQNQSEASWDTWNQMWDFRMPTWAKATIASEGFHGLKVELLSVMVLLCVIFVLQSTKGITLILARQHSNQLNPFSYLFQNSYFIFLEESSHVYFMTNIFFFLNSKQSSSKKEKEQFNP